MNRSQIGFIASADPAPARAPRSAASGPHDDANPLADVITTVGSLESNVMVGETTPRRGLRAKNTMNAPYQHRHKFTPPKQPATVPPGRRHTIVKRVGSVIRFAVFSVINVRVLRYVVVPATARFRFVWANLMIALVSALRGDGCNRGNRFLPSLHRGLDFRLPFNRIRPMATHCEWKGEHQQSKRENADSGNRPSREFSADLHELSSLVSFGFGDSRGSTAGELNVRFCRIASGGYRKFR